MDQVLVQVIFPGLSSVLTSENPFLNIQLCFLTCEMIILKSAPQGIVKIK